MQLTVAEISKLLNGEVVGNPDTVISKVAKIEEGEHQALSFLSNPKYEQYLYITKSSAVIVNRDFKPASEVSVTMIRVDDAYTAFTSLLNKFGKRIEERTGIDHTALVAKSVKFGLRVYIGGLSCIEEH